jgi:hypothetical protein
MTIVNYASSVVNNLGASLTDDASHHLRSSCFYSTGHWDRIHNTSFSPKLTNGLYKLDRYTNLDWKGFPDKNILAYWAHFEL